MNKLIIATHGYMAKGIKSALAIIAGDVSNVIDINAFTEECPNLDQRVAELLSQYQDDEILVLTDVYFGGVNQAFMRAQRDRAFPLANPATGNGTVSQYRRETLSGGDCGNRCVKRQCMPACAASASVGAGRGCGGRAVRRGRQKIFFFQANLLRKEDNS